jgi:DNA/RNA endonuclease YhcR with UshA esterase domain
MPPIPLPFLEISMSIKHLFALAIISASFLVPAFADAPATTQPVTAAATEPSTQPTAFQATDKDAIAKAVGTKATVTGAVSRTNWYNDSILFINFKDTKRGDFTVIAKADNRDALDKAFSGDIAKAVEGKTISVTGKIVKFRETPQIEIVTPDQLTIAPAAATPAPAPKE